MNLYKDITTGDIKTFLEIKAEYSLTIEAELPIDNLTMEQIVMENLVQNGGNIQLINFKNDNVLAWIKQYEDLTDGDFTREEKEQSVKNIYISIMENDEHIIHSLNEVLVEYGNDGEWLLRFLKNILEDLHGKSK